MKNFFKLIFALVQLLVLIIGLFFLLKYLVFDNPKIFKSSTPKTEEKVETKEESNNEEQPVEEQQEEQQNNEQTNNNTNNNSNNTNSNQNTTNTEKKKNIKKLIVMNLWKKMEYIWLLIIKLNFLYILI